MAAKKAKPAAKEPTRDDVVAALQTTDVPKWLAVMRAITGLTEKPGDPDNPKILAMADYIAKTYPEMESYCAQYNHDSIAWCGLTTAFCCTAAGIRPPFGATDTDKFLWAQSFADDIGFQQLDAPRVGCIVVMTREGGGHVTLYESSTNGSYNCRGGNQSDAVNVAAFGKSSVIALLWPKAAGPIPPAERRTLQEGDSGSDVVEVQRILCLPTDGDFGPTTDNAVESFQAAAGLEVDGIVGTNTWAMLDELDRKIAAGDNGLPPDLIAQIEEIANESPLMEYSWRDRGRAPPGYIPGMALCFGLAAHWLDEGISFAGPMMQADRNNADTDALTWLRNEFSNKGMYNNRDGIDTLRHLFVLLIGLGMRESSGKYCEGRDMSADNVEADTAEAGLFQTSWNINTAQAEIPKLMEAYWNDPNGFWPTFEEGITPSASNWDGYGTGKGARYQWLAKYSPAFATMVTAVGLRYRRQHWGPINRKEVELLEQADEMLKDVQDVIEGGVIPEPPEPQPEPEPPEAVVSINVAASGPVRVTLNGQTIVEPE